MNIHPHSFVKTMLGCIIFYTIFSDLSVAEEVKSKDQLMASIGYAEAALFNVSYYKDRYDLELKHHGDLEPENVVMVEAGKKLEQSIDNFRKMLNDIKKEKILLDDESRTEIFRKKVRCSTGSRLIAVFEYVRITSNRDLKPLIKYYHDLILRYDASIDKDHIDTAASWRTNVVPIPIMNNDGEIKWVRATPFELITK